MKDSDEIKDLGEGLENMNLVDFDNTKKKKKKKKKKVAKNEETGKPLLFFLWEWNSKFVVLFLQDLNIYYRGRYTNQGT